MHQLFEDDATSLVHPSLGSLVHSSLQPCSEMFNQIPVWLLARPLLDLHRVVLKPLLLYLGCVLIVVVLLNDEPLRQSKVKKALEQVSIQEVSV